MGGGRLSVSVSLGRPRFSARGSQSLASGLGLDLGFRPPPSPSRRGCPLRFGKGGLFHGRAMCCFRLSARRAGARVCLCTETHQNTMKISGVLDMLFVKICTNTHLVFAMHALRKIGPTHTDPPWSCTFSVKQHRVFTIRYAPKRTNGFFFETLVFDDCITLSRVSDAFFVLVRVIRTRMHHRKKQRLQLTLDPSPARADQLRGI